MAKRIGSYRVYFTKMVRGKKVRVGTQISGTSIADVSRKVVKEKGYVKGTKKVEFMGWSNSKKVW